VIPIHALITAYAIIKYRLMDINIIIRKGLIYSALVTLITTIYFIVILLTERLFKGIVGYTSFFSTVIAISIIAFLFQPLKNKIQSFIDKYFFKGTQEEMARENERLMEEIQRTERLRSVGTLAAGMAHEIKNPLSAIKTFTEYLPQKHNDPEFVDKFHRIVSMETEKINDIVQQLLDFSKPKPLHLEEVHLHDIIDGTLHLLSKDLINRRVDMQRSYDNELSKIYGDRTQLEQVFLNIFLNAIEAMVNGGNLGVATQRTNKWFTVKISDTGVGISRDQLHRVFDPFFSTKTNGTGLGLSIVHGIIKKHGGSVEIESVVGKGSTFIIKLPLQ